MWASSSEGAEGCFACCSSHPQPNSQRHLWCLLSLTRSAFFSTGGRLLWIKVQIFVWGCQKPVYIIRLLWRLKWFSQFSVAALWKYSKIKILTQLKPMQTSPNVQPTVGVSSGDPTPDFTDTQPVQNSWGHPTPAVQLERRHVSVWMPRSGEQT